MLVLVALAGWREASKVRELHRLVLVVLASSARLLDAEVLHRCLYVILLLLELLSDLVGKFARPAR